MSFFVGSAARRAASPILIAMLGRSEFALRRGFAWGKTLVRRKSTVGQTCGQSGRSALSAGGLH